MKRYIGLHYINHPKHLFFTMALVIGGVLGIAYSVQAYPELFKTEVIMGSKNEIKPEDPVIINFSNPVFQDRYSSLQIVDEENSSFQGEAITVSWENSNRKLVIRPKYFWKPENRYRIIIPRGRNKMMIEIPSQTFNFSVVGFPKVESILPANEEKNIVLGIEDPIVVDFNKSAKDFFIKFELDPQSELTYENNPEKTQFKLLPKDKIKEGTQYKIKISARYVKDADQNLKEIFSSSFSTKPLPPQAQDWEKDFALRVEQAKNFTAAQLTSGKYIDINLAQQILCAFENGKVVDCYLISTGKRGMETPKGQFSLRNKASRVWSKKYGLFMPYWMAVASDGSFGIHELPEWPGGYKEGANHLGTPVSHGCIRLGVGSAKSVYNWAEVGTPVIIY